MQQQLTLLAAPAGFGKTMLLSAWIEQSKRPVGWVSLDSNDNDPVQFWA
jgi:LuxR family transcriptional regulator, maltose regulon positive regulatory protein